MKTELLILKDTTREAAARKAAGVLLSGGICIIPTDTLYGIVALDQFPDFHGASDRADWVLFSASARIAASILANASTGLGVEDVGTDD